MKILAYDVNGSEILLDSLDFIVTIEEIENFIKNLQEIKCKFQERQRNAFVEKVSFLNNSIETKKIETYKELEKLNLLSIEDHYHVKDFKNINLNMNVDMNFHTYFIAKKSEDSSFIWKNAIDKDYIK